MEKEQIETVICEYSDMLYRLALMRTGNSVEAQDIVQQTFLKLVEHYDCPDSEEHVKAWLIRVCCNLCTNLSKNPWKVRRIRMEAFQEEALGAVTAEDKIFEQLKKEALWQEVFRLPEKDRTVLHLHYMEEYSPAEIAELLKISYNTVCVRLNRAKKRLAQHLNKEDFWDE